MPLIKGNACASCTLHRLPAFRHVPQATWERFLRAKTDHSYKKGDTIFYQGNRPLGLHFICAGRVKLVKEDPSGRIQIMRFVAAPDLLGDRAFFADRTYACTGEVMEDSHVCFLEGRRFWELFGSEPHALRALLRRFAEELGQAHDMMHCLTVCTVKQRVAKHLLGLGAAPAAPRQGRSILLEDSRTELAEFLGTTLEAVSRTLGEFAAAGWIALDGRRVTILDAEVLRRVACLHVQDS